MVSGLKIRSRQCFCLLFPVFFSIGWNAFSQSTLDQDTYQIYALKDSTEVPFATVYQKSTGKGTHADANGQFQLKIHGEDTLVISSVGYETKILPGKDLDSVIFLEEHVFALDEIVIEGKDSFETSQVGFYKEKNVGAYLGGHSVALWIPNTIEGKSYIKKILITLDKSKVEYKNPKPEFLQLLIRARLSLRNANGKPSCEFFVPNEFLVKVQPKQENIEIDVLRQNLEFPQKGVFVVVDFIGYYQEDEFVPFTSFDKERRIQYQAAISHNHDIANSWVKEYPGSEWKLLDSGPGFNFNFGLEVTYQD